MAWRSCAWEEVGMFYHKNECWYGPEVTIVLLEPTIMGMVADVDQKWQLCYTGLEVFQRA